MKTMCAVMTVMEKTPSWGQAKTELNDTNFLVRIKTFDKDRKKMKEALLKKKTEDRTISKTRLCGRSRSLPKTRTSHRSWCRSDGAFGVQK